MRDGQYAQWLLYFEDSMDIFRTCSLQLEPAPASQFNSAIFSVEILYDIAGELIKTWINYEIPPTEKHLERTVARSLKKFYPDVMHLGGVRTFIDVRIKNIGIDSKGRKVFSNKKPPTSRREIPDRFNTPVRRPNVDLENFRGDSFRILQEAVQDYKNFAAQTALKEGCTEILSFAALYGISKSGVGCLYLGVQEMSFPEIVTAQTTFNKKGKPNGYRGYDVQGNLIYEIEGFNRGSVNLRRVYDTPRNGIFVTFPFNSQHNNHKYTERELIETYNVTSVER